MWHDHALAHLTAEITPREREGAIIVLEAVLRARGCHWDPLIAHDRWPHLVRLRNACCWALSEQATFL